MTEKRILITQEESVKDEHVSDDDINSTSLLSEAVCYQIYRVNILDLVLHKRKFTDT